MLDLFYELKSCWELVVLINYQLSNVIDRYYLGECCIYLNLLFQRLEIRSILLISFDYCIDLNLTTNYSYVTFSLSYCAYFILDY